MFGDLGKGLDGFDPLTMDLAGARLSTCQAQIRFRNAGELQGAMGRAKDYKFAEENPFRRQASTGVATVDTFRMRFNQLQSNVPRKQQHQQTLQA